MARHFSFLSLESTPKNEEAFSLYPSEDVKLSVLGDPVQTISMHLLVAMVVNPKRQLQNIHCMK